jgi:TNF receptor-associated protein 1
VSNECLLCTVDRFCVNIDFYVCCCRKIRLLLTQRIIRFLQEQSKKEKSKYQEFYEDYKLFFKEGIVRTADQGEKEDIAKLLRFDSSREQQGSLISLEEYIDRMLPEQKHIYYLAGPSRELCENSPYYEAIRQKGYEVLFVYESHDEVLLMQLAEFDKKKMKSVESELETDTKKDDTILEGGQLKQLVSVVFVLLRLYALNNACERVSHEIDHIQL